jgi:hypothetical protein
VVCLARDEWINGRIGDVTIATTHSLVPLMKTRRTLLTAAAVETVANDLRVAFDAVREQAMRGPVPPRTPAPKDETEATGHRGERRRIPILRTLGGVALVAVVILRPDVLDPVKNFVGDIVSTDPAEPTDGSTDGTDGSTDGPLDGQDDKAPTKDDPVDEGSSSG